MKPTEERAERFWKWCGFTYLPYKGDPLLGKIHDACWLNPNESGLKPDNWHFNLPVIDLNNLFKWAIPRVDGYKLVTNPEIPDVARAEVRVCNRYFCDGDKDPALALFWAIMKVIDGDNTPAEH